MHPLIYEINTRCWLWDLSEKDGRVTLANVPESEFARWRYLGFTHIWLMGVWTVGPRARDFSRGLAELKETQGRLLPDFCEEDVVGSAYAIAGYEVSQDLGGELGLSEFRERLHANGVKLVLDFIPNHTGIDNLWLDTRPDLFVQSPACAPGTFSRNTSRGEIWIAHGRDPYFPPWADTAQLDYRNPATQAAMIEQLQLVAQRCDGVRCDMAMLVLKDVFAATWAQFPRQSERRSPNRRAPHRQRSIPVQGPGRGGMRSEVSVPSHEFWAEAISTIKGSHPELLFLAEAYWDLETRLLELGFDFAYDKRVTDLIVARRPAELQRHLLADSARAHRFPAEAASSPGSELAARADKTICQLAPKETVQRVCEVDRDPSVSGRGMNIAPAFAHFLENHDEPRAASLLSVSEHRAAALLMLGLPGLRLLHEGQLTGATVRASVHLRRRPPERAQKDIVAFYELFLSTLQETVVGKGQSHLLKPVAAWDANRTSENIVVIQWQLWPMRFDLVVVNLAGHASQCYVDLQVERIREAEWEMTNLLGEEHYKRSGANLEKGGLFLDILAHGAQLFRFVSIAPAPKARILKSSKGDPQK